MKNTLALFVIVLSLAACSRPATNTVLTVTPTEATPVMATFPTLPAQTPTASASSNPTPFAPFTVNPTVDNVNLRMNPGYFFDAFGLVHQSDTLTVLGKAPGDEWIYIETADGTKGWVFSQLLTSDVDLQQLPIQEPTDVQLIKGKVVDANGTPIQGIGFEVKQGTETDAQANVVTTDANGEFFSFMPTTSSGTWTINQVAVACLSNVWSDSSCGTYKSGYTGVVEPQTLTVVLPQTGALAFTWK